MYNVTLSSALFLLEKHAWAVSVAAIEVIVGWPFSVLVVLPVAVYSLIKGYFVKVFLSGTATSLLIFVILSFVVDHYYYGKWTSSVLNLLYNVWGGDGSHLYGTEGILFYFRNGFNNFKICFVLALLFLAILPFIKKKCDLDLFVVISPMYIWLIFMSLQPHKEERFLYPIYPLICVAAAVVLESFPGRFRDKYATEDSAMIIVAKVLRSLVFGIILCASHSRTFSMLHGYSASQCVFSGLHTTKKRTLYSGL
ncbi:Alpha-1,2-mannosyltransferase ALG9, family GT22 [Zostera marina]|uniref:Mannosyltransferase n=1 Tax=Zostera marina TaxID=29655 RepID=A0A0K9PM13_ZOSMR|nr:Alpha-1,2-mannosyltransferase ALG9, family GT22 [Zostera marina]